MPISGIDLAALAIELVVSAATGAWMGAIAHFRPLAPAGATSARWESRTGWWGLTLWLLVVAVRVGIDVVAVRLGAGMVTSTGVILLVLAANRLVRPAGPGGGHPQPGRTPRRPPTHPGLGVRTRAEAIARATRK